MTRQGENSVLRLIIIVAVFALICIARMAYLLVKP